MKFIWVRYSFVCRQVASAITRYGTALSILPIQMYTAYARQDKLKPVSTIKCATTFPNVSIRSQLYIVGLYPVNFCPFHPLRSTGISFTPVKETSR